MNVDEAGQYWMALGQFHYTPFYTSDQDFAEVVQQNIHYNLDPGGFTFLLHFWLKISKSYLWIKLLPLLFFLGFVFYLVKLLKLFRFEGFRNFQFLIVPLLFISNALPFYAVLFRAYSFEYFGLSITLYYLFSAKKPEQFYLKTGILCALFLWSRYGFAIHILAIYLISIARFDLLANKRLFLINSIKFSLPVLSSLLLLYFVTLKYQYTDPITNPQYLRYIIHGNFQKAVELILSQLLSFINIPILLLAGFFLSRKIRVMRQLNLSVNPFSLKILLIYFALYHLINFSLSFLGLYPYSIHSYNSKQFELFNILSIYFLLLILVDKVPNIKYLAFLGIVCIGCVLAFFKRELGTNNLLPVLKKYNEEKPLYLSRTNFPTTRYLVEQKIIKSNYSFIQIYNPKMEIKAESLVIYNISEDVYDGKITFDSSFKRTEKFLKSQKNYDSEVYIKR